MRCPAELYNNSTRPYNGAASPIELSGDGDTPDGLTCQAALHPELLQLLTPEFCHAPGINLIECRYVLLYGSRRP
jgi:hypothetical protein